MSEGYVSVQSPDPAVRAAVARIVRALPEPARSVVQARAWWWSPGEVCDGFTFNLHAGVTGLVGGLAAAGISLPPGEPDDTCYVVMLSTRWPPDSEPFERIVQHEAAHVFLGHCARDRDQETIQADERAARALADQWEHGGE